MYRLGLVFGTLTLFWTFTGAASAADDRAMHLGISNDATISTLEGKGDAETSTVHWGFRGRGWYGGRAWYGWRGWNGWRGWYGGYYRPYYAFGYRYPRYWYPYVALGLGYAYPYYSSYVPRAYYSSSYAVAPTSPYAPLPQASPSPSREAPRSEELPPPQRARPEKGYRYDGGPTKPVPLPGGDKNPTSTPEARPARDFRAVSLPLTRTLKLSYLAYGERPGKPAIEPEQFGKSEPQLVQKPNR